MQNSSSTSRIGFQSLLGLQHSLSGIGWMSPGKQASSLSLLFSLKKKERRFSFSLTRIRTLTLTESGSSSSSLNPKSCSYHPVFLPPLLCPPPSCSPKLPHPHPHREGRKRETERSQQQQKGFALPPSPPPVPSPLLKCDVQSIRLLLVQSPTPLLGQSPLPTAAPSPPASSASSFFLIIFFDGFSVFLSPPSYGIRPPGWKRIGAAVAEAKLQPGDLDPRHHHRVPHGGDGSGGAGQQEAADEDHHHYRLLQLHQQGQQQQQQQQDQEPPPVPVFQLSHHLQSVRQPAGEYALLAPMGDAGQSHSHHHHGLQTQLLSFGGGAANHHHPHMHQFTAQPQPPAASQTRARGGRGGGGGELVSAATPARVRGGGGGGEIVAVQGGHIVRATGRKDRHSKVCTARGPRDRRVRLSAHTAIQFYDVQDRLGYDRPSKAVDWLIKNAKDAIDSLDTLPAWQPTAVAPASSNAAAPPSSSTHPDSADNSDDQAQAITIAHTSFDFAASGGGSGGAAGGISFLPPSLDSDSIADTIKSFFPMGGTAGGEASSSTVAAAHSSAMSFQSYTPDLLSRTGSQSQELRLSLQPLPADPMFHHQQQQEQHRSHSHHEGNGTAQQAIFPGAANYSFGGGTMWGEQAQSQRMLPWSMPGQQGGGGGAGSTGGYLFNVSQQAAHMQAALSGQNQFFFQRGPLQSSNQPSSDRGWPESVEADNSNPMQQQHHHHQGGSNPSAVGFAPGVSFSGFRIPARIQGDEDHGGGNGDKPPSVSSASHH